MPRAGWKKPESERRLADLVSVGVLTRVFPPGLVDEVIAAAGRREQRHRSLPARVMAYFSIGMALYSEGSYEDVLGQLTDGLSWVSGWQECCHYAIRSLMADAATHAWHDLREADRVSFVAALRITRQTIAQPGAFPP